MIRTILFSALCIVIFGCSKEKPDFSLELGKARHLLNGIETTPAKVRILDNITFPTTLDLQFNTNDADGFPLTSLSFFKIPKKEGKYTLQQTVNNIDSNKIGAAYFTLSNQGDVLEEYYVIDESKSDNFIDISYYSKKEKEIAGSYNITMVINPDRGKNNPASPDTIHVSSGEFHLSL